MTLQGEDKSLKVLVKLRNLNGKADPEGIRLLGFSADVFVELRGDMRIKGQRKTKVQALARIPAAKPVPARKIDP